MITKEIVKSLPSHSGVYKYLDENGLVLYVGKANNLKNRVKSYWRFTPKLHPNPTLPLRIQKMLKEAKRVEFIVVDSPVDALILENSLIKQLKPKYNILLRDDKTYPYIYLDLNDDFPRFEITRQVIEKKGVHYWGPFPNGSKALLDAIYSTFTLVQKKGLKNQKSACLFFQMKRCLAPCEERVSKEDYKTILNQALEAIKNPTILIEKLNQRMQKLAQKERFEEAIKLREQINQIQKLQLHSDLDIAKSESFDIFAIKEDGQKGVVFRLFIRDGRVISSSYSIFRDLKNFQAKDAYKQEIISFYSNQIPLVKTILTPQKPSDQSQIEEFLSQKLEQRVKILIPKRGLKAKLVELALKNCDEILKKSTNYNLVLQEDLAKLLNLKRVPNRVEVFDNSHLFGQAPVGAMVVWESGRWEKSSFRRFNLKFKDEYHQMRELLERRVDNFISSPPPDLWLIDGGENLRLIAKEILKGEGVNIDVVAISKERPDPKSNRVNRAKGGAFDKIYFDGGELRLSKSDKRLLWLQKLRDKVHSFALASHRKKRIKESLEVELLTKKGIGEATLLKLLSYFGSFETIKKASKDELKKVVGERLIEVLMEYQKE